MASVGYATLDVIPSLKGMQGHLEKGLTGPSDAAGKSAGRRLSAGMASSVKSSARTIFAPLLAAGAIFKGAQFLKSTIKEASDLNESLNAVNVSYGKSAAGVQRLGRQAATSIGLSNVEFNSLAVRFSSFSKTIAGGGGNVTKTLDTLTKRAGDFASVMNLEVADAAELFQSGLAGETEPLRRYGLDLSAARVEAFAYANGIGKAGKQLTETQKVQARYGLLMKQTAQTQGDFRNTSGELANQQRILNARWDNAKASLGKAFLPLMKESVGFLNKEGIPAFAKVSDKVTRFFRQMRSGKGAGGDFADALGEIKDGLTDAFRVGRKLVGLFNDLPSGLKKAVGITAGLAIVVPKIPGAKTAGSLAGGLLKGGVQKVYVVNPGFGGPGNTPGTGPGRPRPRPKPPLLSASPYLLPLFLGGDSAPPKRSPKTNRAIAAQQGLQSDLGLKKGLGVDKALANVFKSDPAKGFRLLGKAAKTAGVDVDHFATKAMPKTRAEIDHAGGSLAAFRKRSANTSSAMQRLIGDVTGTGRALSRSHLSTNQFARALKTLPKGVQTKVLTPGAIKSKSDVQALGRQFHLTPKQVKTLMRLIGVDPAIAKARALQRQLQAIKDRKVYITTYYSRVNSANKRAALGGPDHAAGGWITGPGSGTSDSISARLSNGEFVVREREARRHRALLEAINSGRFANGGSVGGSNAPVTVSGGGDSVFHLYDSSGTLMGTMRGIARSEVNGRRALSSTLARQGG